MSFVINFGKLEKYTGRKKDVVIPDGVTSIGRDAFHRKSLISVTIPDGVTSIGNNAFSLCENLTNITIPDSVANVGSEAFRLCSNLTSIILPNNLKSIGSGAFERCRNLTNIIIPDSVTSIGKSAFWGCEKLTSITIPNGVTSIGESAFWGCEKLTSITIPDSVTSIGERAFFRCKNLTNITISDSVTSIGNEAFHYCNNLVNITIPDSLTSIGDYAFSGCSKLTSITIPDGVTSIGSGAFSGCSELTNITIPDSVISIGSGAFSGCTKLANLTVPDHLTNIGRCISGCRLLADKEGFIIIRNVLYDYCGDEKHVIIPDSVTSIWDGVFSEREDITNITLPDSLTSIDEYAFAYCENLVNITIPDSVTSIGSNAFEGCEKLENIILPNGLKSIGNSTFLSCHKLTDITIPEGVISIEDEAFMECNISKICFPDSLKKIGTKAFFENNLKQVNLPKNLTFIGDAAFDENQITDLIIPKTVTDIGGSIFGKHLKTVTVYDSIEPNGAITQLDEYFESIFDCKLDANIGRIGIPYSEIDFDYLGKWNSFTIIVKSAENNEEKFRIPMPSSRSITEYLAVAKLWNKNATFDFDRLFKIFPQLTENRFELAFQMFKAADNDKQKKLTYDLIKPEFFSHIKKLISSGTVKDIEDLLYLNLIDASNINKFIRIAERYDNSEMTEYFTNYKVNVLGITETSVVQAPDGFEEIPSIKEKKDYVKYMNVEGSDITQVGFRGLNSEITKLIDFMDIRNIPHSECKKFGVNISEVWLRDPSKTFVLIETFPQLKATGMIEDKDGDVCVWYSDSGHTTYTEYKKVGYYDGKADGGNARWALKKHMLFSFELKFRDMRTGELVEVNYSFPFKNKWMEDNYLVEIDGLLYKKTAGNSTSGKKRMYIKVKFDNGKTYSYFSEYQVKIGDIVYVPGKMTGHPGTVVEIMNKQPNEIAESYTLYVTSVKES